MGGGTGACSVALGLQVWKSARRGDAAAQAPSGSVAPRAPESDAGDMMGVTLLEKDNPRGGVARLIGRI